MQREQWKPGRTARITEELDAVDISELQLESVTGGCSNCGCSQPDAACAQPQEQQQRPGQLGQVLPFVNPFAR